ncbi:MAG: hypothetical protein JWM85_689 [Acidimicrobiaceae bacterium]|nr:hypothetical protein [Acidimicrobiaceae bacterium]
MEEPTGEVAPGETGPDVTAVLSADHVAIRADLQALVEERRGADRRERMEQLGRELARHEVAEQEAVYPVLAQIESGREIREQALRQEREGALALARAMRRTSWRAGGRTTGDQLDQLAELLVKHIDFEDAHVVPLLRLRVDEEKRHMMGTWFTSAKAAAPTRPHPHAPQNLLGLLGTGPVLALADRMRDRLRALLRPRRRPSGAS